MNETNIDEWLELLKAWYREINENIYYRESAYCDFKRTDDGKTYLSATIVLRATPASLLERAQGDHSPVDAAQDEQNLATKLTHVDVTNDGPKLVKMLPTREEAAYGKVVVRKLSETASRETAPSPPSGTGTSNQQKNKALSPKGNDRLNATSDFNTTASERINLGNDLSHEKSTLNHDLSKLLVLRSPPAEESGVRHIPIVLDADQLKNEPCLQTEAGRYGLLLRAALLAKVTGSKANLSLYINRLEDIRALFARADALKLSSWQKAALSNKLFVLLEGTHLWVQSDKNPETDSKSHVRDSKNDSEADGGSDHAPEYKEAPHQIILDELDQFPSNFRKCLPTLAWYHWHRTVPALVNNNATRLTLTGHILAYGAFASLIWLSLSGEALSDSMFSLPGMHYVPVWLIDRMPDPALLAIALAVLAGLVYALTTKRLTLKDRFALTINDKIEKVLDSILADLMKANMDVQIGRIGRGEPPGTIPESVSRKLDEIFAMKELVNSYESTVRARRRHVAEEVSKEQSIRLERNQRLRNAALGVTASFVLFEIGSRIQDHRDLIAGTDPYSFSYWMSRRQKNGNGQGTSVDAANPAQANATQGETETAVYEPQTTLKCAYTEIKEQSPPSPECLDQWRGNALGSSSELLFLVFLIAMLIFFVRVIRRDDSKAP